jgi:hypothetical protein
MVAGCKHILQSPPRKREVLEMYLMIRYAGGSIVEGVVLAKGADRLRVAAAGFPETIELRRTGALWSADDGEQVEFYFVMGDTDQAERVSSSTLAYAAMVV